MIAPVGHPSAAAWMYATGSLDALSTIAFVSASCAKVKGANAMHTPLPMHISLSTETESPPPTSVTDELWAAWPE